MQPAVRLVTSEDFVLGGPAHSLAARLGLSPDDPKRRAIKVGLLFLLTCVPLLVLSLLAGHAWGDQVRFPFLRDLDAYGRFMFALPMLELGAMLVAASLPVQVRYFHELGLVAAAETSRFEAAQFEMIRLRDSVLADVLKLALAMAFPAVTRVGLGFSVGDSSWERLGLTITPAGWWYIVVSLPVLFFILLRRVWVFLVWAWFLFRVSRLDLKLTSTHPDRSGGLGFVARGQMAFSLLLMACAAIVSAGFGEEILNRGKSLDDLKYHIALFMGLALLVLHAPLLAFSRRMIRCQVRGLLDFSLLVFRYDRAFDEKWIEKSGPVNREDILGHPDIQSFANIAMGYGHVEEMRSFPFDRKAFLVLALAAALPMLPLLGTTIPFREILMKLGELMV